AKRKVRASGAEKMIEPLARLPFHAGLDGYQRQADALLAGWRSGETSATKFFAQQHPRFRDDRIKWLARQVSEAELRSVPMEIDDARLAVARWYDFESWDALAEYVAAGTRARSPGYPFSAAVPA